MARWRRCDAITSISLVKIHGLRAITKGKTVNWKTWPSNTSRRYFLDQEWIHKCRYVSVKSMETVQLWTNIDWHTDLTVSILKGCFLCIDLTVKDPLPDVTLFLGTRILIVLGFNDTSTLEGHFVSSPREREKRDRRESRGDERGTGKKEEQEWKWRNRRNKNIPPLPLPTTRIAGLAQL